MIYRLAANEDLDQMMAMVDQAKASFKARGIDQWQKGEPARQRDRSACWRRTGG